MQQNDRLKFWRRVLIGIALFAIVSLFAIPFVSGYLLAYTLTQGTCISPSSKPDDYGLVAEDVSFPSGEYTIAAYFIPGETDGTVILAPTLNQNRNGQLDYAAMFHDVGLNVLVMPSRLCFGGVSTLGYDEGDDVRAAYTYLITRDDVNPERVSAHGFSVGGAAAMFGAARTPELRAVSAMGNYMEFEDAMGTNVADASFAASLTALGVRVGYRVGTGKSVTILKPIEAIDAINPRPILFVYGTLELNENDATFTERAENGTLWMVEGVGHGGYLQAYPEEGREIIGGFHVDALLGDSE